MEIFEGEVLRLWYEGEILLGVYKPSTVDLEVAKQAIKERKKFTKNKPVIGVVDYRNVKVTTKEARAYFSSPEARENVVAVALIVSNLVTTFIINFILKIDKPKVISKIFTDIESGKKWLQQFLADQHS